MNTVHHGPQFEIESDKAMIVLGFSERTRVGQLFAETLDGLGLFDEIDIVPLNKSVALYGRHALRKAMEERTVITHSAGILRVPRALQVIALNPPEQMPLPELIKRARVDVPAEPIIAEPGAHETGLGDMAGAGFELVRSPIVTARTALDIAHKFSTVERLTDTGATKDFPAGRAIIHSEYDAFRFTDLAGFGYWAPLGAIRAAKAGVSSVTIEGAYHNEVLFAPGRIIESLTPVIFPETDPSAVDRV